MAPSGGTCSPSLRPLHHGAEDLRRGPGKTRNGDRPYGPCFVDYQHYTSLLNPADARAEKIPMVARSRPSLACLYMLSVSIHILSFCSCKDHAFSPDGSLPFFCYRDSRAGKQEDSLIARYILNSPSLSLNIDLKISALLHIVIIYMMASVPSIPILFICLFVYFVFLFILFLPFLGLLPWHMEVPRLGV